MLTARDHRGVTRPGKPDIKDAAPNSSDVEHSFPEEGWTAHRAVGGRHARPGDPGGGPSSGASHVGVKGAALAPHLPPAPARGGNVPPPPRSARKQPG